MGFLLEITVWGLTWGAHLYINCSLTLFFKNILISKTNLFENTVRGSQIRCSSLEITVLKCTMWEYNLRCASLEITVWDFHVGCALLKTTAWGYNSRCALSEITVWGYYLKCALLKIRVSESQSRCALLKLQYGSYTSNTKWLGACITCN